jgi:NAD(P)-dependent dehydrogenase (short-subunit alcohol dehydrogenase family)
MMQTVLVTGANRGIGLEHTTRFAERGDTVIAAVRTMADAADLQALARAHPGAVMIVPYDAADPASPAEVAAAVGDRPIDLLLNNAGVYGGDAQTLTHLDPQAFMTVMATNTLAPLVLAQALLPAIKRSRRKIIANQSSRMGSIADNGSGGFYAYRASKAALNMVTKSLAEDLRGDGVIAVSLHPGWVRTRMGGPNAPVSAQDCVAGQQKLLDSLTLKESGRFFDFTGAALEW